MLPVMRVIGQLGAAIVFKRLPNAEAQVAHDIAMGLEYEVASSEVAGANGTFCMRVDAVRHAMDAVGGPCELEEM